MSELNADLLQGLVTVGLVLLLWGAIAVPASLVRRVFSGLGLERFPKRAADVAQQQSLFGAPVASFFQGLEQSARAAAGGPSVELALDERHRGLRRIMKRAEQAIREAADRVVGHEGAEGPKRLAAEVGALREQTKAVERIGADFDEDLADQYAARSGASVWLVALLFGSALVLALNGTLLAQFARELLPVRVLGITVGEVLAYAIVVVEVLIGLALGLGVKKNVGLSRVLIVGAALLGGLALAAFEFAAFLALSANIDESFYETAPLPVWWMAPLGPALVILNALCGYLIHDLADELARSRGVVRLQRELKLAGDFVTNLPKAWDSIDAKARSAQNSVQRYIDELGGQADRMGGLVDRVQAERDTILAALNGLRLDDTVLAGKEGDVSRAWARAVGLFGLAVLWTGGFTLGFMHLLTLAFQGVLPPIAAAGVALLIAVGFAVVGHVAYGRVQHVSGQKLQPVSTSPLGAIAVTAFGVGALVGICWACVTALGGWGILAGVLITALCIPLTIVGYRIDEVARGGMLIVTTIARFSVAMAHVLFVVARYVVLWALAALAWTLNAGLSLLAAPVDLIIRLLQRRGARPAQTSANQAPAPIGSRDASV